MTRRSAWKSARRMRGLTSLLPISHYPSGKSDQHAMLLELDDGTTSVLRGTAIHELAQIQSGMECPRSAARSIL